MRTHPYRDQAYRLRSHTKPQGPLKFPPSPKPRLVWVPLSFSMLAFLTGEYFAEVSLATLPSGMVFPLGFTLFWTFYLTLDRREGLLLLLFWQKLVSSRKRPQFRQVLPPRPGAQRPLKTQDPIPADIRRSLQVLGLSGMPKWQEIHRRYRVLAKQLHPDIHPGRTELVSKFIELDTAYRKLLTYRDKFI